MASSSELNCRLMLPHTRTGILLVAFVWSTLLTCLPDAGAQVFDAREENLVNGLRNRGLYLLAEKHCADLLQMPGLTAIDHASIAIERIRTETSAATTGPDQAKAWRKVDRIADEFDKTQSSNPRAVLVGLQQALAHISFANTIEREVVAHSANEQRRQLGLEELRRSRSILDQNRRKATQDLKQAANGNRLPGSLSSEQLRTLITSFDYQLAIVNLTTAKLLSDKTDAERLDRIDSLGRVLEQLSAVRASVSNTRALWWKTWINEAACRRMMGDAKAAAKLLQTMQTKKRPSSTNEMLLQEEIELAIAIGDSSRLQAVANRARKQNVSAETEIAILRLLVAAGQIESASELATRITARAEPYWTRRADLALLSGGRSTDRTTVASDAQTRLLLQAAQKAEKSGNLGAALDGYRSVANAQFSAGRPANGLATIAMAGKILEQQKKHQAAADNYLKPAAFYKEQPAAASVHLRGCWNLSKAKSESIVDELRFHIESWPDSDSSNQARLWLGSVLVSNQEYEAAMKALVQTSSRSQHFPAALKLARAACRKQLSVVESGNATTTPLAKRLLEHWTDAFESCEDSKKCLVAVAMAELGFAWKAESIVTTRDRIKQLESLPSARSNAEFMYWLAVASGSADEVASANQLPFDTAMVRQLLKSLNRVESGPSIAAIKLKIADHAIAKTEDSRIRNEFLLTKAVALAESGDRDSAISELKQLVATDPKNLAAQLALARVLPSEAALKLWRSIADRTKAQSDAWFEAKYNVAKLLSNSGRGEEAAKILQYMKAIPPGWSASKISSDFDRLLQKVSRN